MATGYSRCYAKIDLDAIEYNFDLIKNKLGDKVMTMAIVKADAYGHGAVEVAQRLEEKADYFAVAALSEAIELRKAGIGRKLLVLSYVSPMEYELLFEYDIIPSIYNLQEALLLNEKAAECGTVATVHLAVDTGMSRIGFSDTKESADIIRTISLLERIRIEGIFSHYATADEEDKSFALMQKKRFDAFLSLLEQEGVSIPVRHISNSAGALEFDEHYDMARLGISLYGYHPSEHIKNKLPLRKAMQVISHVVHVKTVEKGTGIGYGQEFTAPKKMKIATVAIGYADGFCRMLEREGYVLIKGKKAHLTGRVCMDLIMVDVTEIEDVKSGDEAVILGRSGEAEITAEDLGRMCSSISYEMLCSFSPRVQRIY